MAPDSYPAIYFYLSGSNISLKAIPSPGYRFVSWIGGPPGSSESVSIDVTCNMDITALFTRITYPLAVNISAGNSGKIAMEPPQPDDGYVSDTEVTVEAIASKGYKFSHWSGAVSGSENPTTIVMDSEKQINASFTKIPWLESFWWCIPIGVIVIGLLVYFLVVRRLGAHEY